MLDTVIINETATNGNSVYDKVWIRNSADVSIYEDITDASDYQPTFNPDTVFLAEFENDLVAGNTDNVPIITGWRVTKREVDAVIENLVGEVDVDTRNISDYRVQKDRQYIYQVRPKTSTTLGESFFSNTETSDYYGIFLIDETTDTVLDFEPNGIVGEMSAQDDKTVYNTFNKFNTISIGEKDLLRGSITGIVSSVSICTSGTITQSADFVETIQNLINNGNPKLLKTRKGDIFKVVTSGFSRGQWVTQLKEQFDTISFSWEEIEDVEDYK